MSRNLESADAFTQTLDPIAAPKAIKPSRSKVVSVRVTEDVLNHMIEEMKKLGVTSAAQRQAFLRGAMLAGIVNARRARSSSWRTFLKAIQPLARKHLGMGLAMDGAEGFLKKGA